MTTINSIHDIGRVEVSQGSSSTDESVLFAERDLCIWLNMSLRWRTVPNAALIASDMGFVWQKTLNRQEVVALVDEAVRTGKAEGIPSNHLRVLRRTDLMMEVTNDRGETAFVVTEVSWTAAQRDTERAIRNAGYVAGFTGTPTYAAVASVHVDKEIVDMLTQDAPRPHGASAHERAFHAALEDTQSLV